MGANQPKGLCWQHLPTLRGKVIHVNLEHAGMVYNMMGSSSCAWGAGGLGGKGEICEELRKIVADVCWYMHCLNQ